MYLLRKIYYPEIFQGKNKRKNYFEGWYYRIIDKNMKHALAIIPGVALGHKEKDAHGFIQILDGESHESHYIKYPISTFAFNKKKFEIEVAGNYFSQKEIHLDIKGDNTWIKGNLSFRNIIKYPKKLLHPGIMGPYSFVPFMECYHGIVNIHHDIVGELNIKGKKVDFNGGYGYIEKDWGRSFPQEWIWFQSSHFDKADVTIMFSRAKIPWMGRHFYGFISFIRIKDGVHLFSTYTKAKMIAFHYDENSVEVVLEDKNYTLEMKVKNSHGGVLKAPQNGFMNRHIIESINGIVEAKLINKKGEVIFEGQGTRTGLEIVNKME